MRVKCTVPLTLETVVFGKVLGKYFGGEPDRKTMEMLNLNELAALVDVDEIAVRHKTRHVIHRPGNGPELALGDAIRLARFEPMPASRTGKDDETVRV